MTAVEVLRPASELLDEVKTAHRRFLTMGVQATEAFLNGTTTVQPERNPEYVAAELNLAAAEAALAALADGAVEFE